MAIIDIGGGTTDIAITDMAGDVNVSQSDTHSIGLLNLYEDINKALKFEVSDSGADIPRKELEDAVLTGVIRKIDYSSTITLITDEFVAKILNKVHGLLANPGLFEAGVWLVGGGAHVLKSAVKAYIPDIKVHKEPEYANVLGMYKLGAMTIQ